MLVSLKAKSAKNHIGKISCATPDICIIRIRTSKYCKTGYFY